MKVISTGSGYQIYDDSLKTYDRLPAQAYSVGFNSNSGFFLVKYSDIEIKEKTYGIHINKVQKVANTFEKTNRNLGVILSGAKGIGKSLFAKMLAAEGVSRDYPVIVVDHYYPGIASFLDEIEQEVYVLFDEFDKTFGSTQNNKDSLKDPQTEMLTLFDGISQGKKLFIITCNQLRNLNDYLVNRPGRFHYHFRFEYPQAQDITAYLLDKNISQEEIKKVVAFSSKVKLNYDCLRSIAFELQMGEKFEDAILDLNIINQNNEKYNIMIYFKDGSHLSTKYTFDMFSNDEIVIDFEGKNYWDLGFLTFLPTDAIYDTFTEGYKVMPPNATWTLEERVIKTANNIENQNFDEEYIKFTKSWIEKEFSFAVIKPVYDRNIHYMI